MRSHLASDTCVAWWWRRRAFWGHGGRSDRAIPVQSSFTTTYFGMKRIRMQNSSGSLVRKSCFIFAYSSEIRNPYESLISEGSAESFLSSKAETLVPFGPAWFFDCKARFPKIVDPTSFWIPQFLSASSEISHSSKCYLHLESWQRVLNPCKGCYFPTCVSFD